MAVVWCSGSCSCCSCNCLSVCLSIYLSVCLFVCLSVYLQAWKRSNFATLPQFLNLTTSKTKQFCKTSSILELDTTQKEALLRDFLNFWTWQHQKGSNSASQIWKVECRADGLVPMRFAIFPLHLFKVLRLPRKSEARSYEVLHL